MPKRPAKDENVAVTKAIRTATGSPKTDGASLLGSPRLKRLFREAKRRVVKPK